MEVLDLQSFLGCWPYDPENNVRVAHGADGRGIILVRQPMGLEHYEIDGRPDGRRIQRRESVFDFHRTRFDAAKQSNVLNGFDLSAKDCAELVDESVLYHRRLLVLFRLKDWTRVERDAAHNLRLIEFIKQHARCEEDRVQLDHWRPDIARIDAVARAMILLEKGQYRAALRIACDIISDFRVVADDWPDHGTLAEALVESVRESHPKGPTLGTDEESLFVQHNDYWTIRYHGHEAFLKDSRGLHCLALLLRYPCLL
jgi:DNA-binding XRE family transcriptional regulator